MKYFCAYCYREMPEGCDHPNVFACCGEFGHVVTEKEMEEEANYDSEFDREEAEWGALNNDEDDIDDSMDGDAASALASAGWGTDEDYGCAYEDDLCGDIGGWDE